MYSIVSTLVRNRLSEKEYEKYYNSDLDNFLNYECDLTRDLSTIQDMDKAADILHYTIKNEGLIVVIGDIDQDGILGSYCIYNSLLNVFHVDKDNVKLIIGTRRQGRGINRYVLEKLYGLINRLNRYPSLIITVDHGSTDENSYREIKERIQGCEIIVTDHHTVEYNKYPISADAFINVHRKDNTYSKYISGCVTGFLVMYYTYYKHYDTDMKVFDYLLPYAGLSTIGDVMSMKCPINRYLVNEGLRILDEEGLDENFTVLKQLLNLPPKITYKDFAMSIAPFINTGNRMGCEEYALLSLVLDNIQKKKEIMEYIAKLNRIRKDSTREMSQEVLYSPDVSNYDYGNVIAIRSNALIAGPIASNISGLLRRPVICIGDLESDGVYNGSGRCDIPGVSILGILKAIQRKHKGVIKQANGHQGACGVTIFAKRLTEFRRLFNKYSKKATSKVTLEYPQAEWLLAHKDINMYTYGQVLKAAPYGLNWKEPIFESRSLKVKKLFKIKTFYKVTFELDDGYLIEGMYFFKHISMYGLNNMNLKDHVKEGSKVDVLYNLVVNYYNSRYSIQLEIVDIRPAGGLNSCLTLSLL